MDKKNLIIIGLVVVILIIGIWQFFKPSITGNVVNTGADTIVDSETTEGNLTEESKIINEVDYSVKVQDELTNKPLQDAFIYLDGEFVGKTSNKGELTVDSVEFGKHSLRADYKGESSAITEEVTELNNRSTISIKAPRTITLELIDSETNKPINDAKVFLETTSGKAFFSVLPTNDKGKTQFEDILPGNYHLIIENYQSAKPSDLVVIGKNDIITAEVDMPNPQFKGSIRCGKGGPVIELIYKQYGQCEVTITNKDYDKGIDSQHTIVVIYAYKIDENGNYIQVGQDVLDFGTIKKGTTSEPKRTKEMYGVKKYDKHEFVAVIYEGWKYTPDNNSNVGEIQMSAPLLDKLVSDSIMWCDNNLEKCGEAIAGVVKAAIVA